MNLKKKLITLGYVFLCLFVYWGMLFGPYSDRKLPIEELSPWSFILAWPASLPLAFIALVLTSAIIAKIFGCTFGKNDVYWTLNFALILVAFSPLLVFLLDHVFFKKFGLFDSSCQAVGLKHHAWYTLDSLLKGALMDFMESFNIDLFSCPPSHSLKSSVLTFALRTLSSSIILWLLIRTWIATTKRDD